MTPGKLESGGIGFGGVENDRLFGRAGREAAKETIGDLGIVGEERADLEAAPAGAQDAVAQEPAPPDRPERRRARLGDPASQKGFARRGKHEGVVAKNLVEGDGGKVGEARRRRAAALAFIADVAVGERESGLLVVRLLRDDPVAADMVFSRCCCSSAWCSA